MICLIVQLAFPLFDGRINCSIRVKFTYGSGTGNGSIFIHFYFENACLDPLNVLSGSLGGPTAPHCPVVLTLCGERAQVSDKKWHGYISCFRHERIQPEHIFSACYIINA